VCVCVCVYYMLSGKNKVNYKHINVCTICSL